MTPQFSVCLHFFTTCTYWQLRDSKQPWAGWHGVKWWSYSWFDKHGSLQQYCRITHNTQELRSGGLKKMEFTVRGPNPLTSKLKKPERWSMFHETNSIFAKLSQAKPQLQLSWLALASLNFTKSSHPPPPPFIHPPPSLHPGKFISQLYLIK